MNVVFHLVELYLLGTILYRQSKYKPMCLSHRAEKILKRIEQKAKRLADIVKG